MAGGRKRRGQSLLTLRRLENLEKVCCLPFSGVSGQSYGTGTQTSEKGNLQGCWQHFWGGHHDVVSSAREAEKCKVDSAAAMAGNGHCSG